MPNHRLVIHADHMEIKVDTVELVELADLLLDTERSGMSGPPEVSLSSLRRAYLSHWRGKY